jgi:hypothetical protein
VVYRHNVQGPGKHKAVSSEKQSTSIGLVVVAYDSMIRSISYLHYFV